MLRLEQHKFYPLAKGWRSWNSVCKSTSQPSSGGHTIYIYIYIYEGRGKREDLKEEGVFVNYLRTGMWFGP